MPKKCQKNYAKLLASILWYRWLTGVNLGVEKSVLPKFDNFVAAKR